MAAPTTCSPCDCLTNLPQLALSKDSYQASQLSILCGILASLSGGSGPSANVNVTNGVGAAAVNIRDGGNSITVDGSVTVTQATGTNLHAVLDSGSTTTVTQATGTNLHAVIDSGSTTAVTQATGTNLHTVVDSGTITTVSAVTTLNAVVPGTGATNLGKAEDDAHNSGDTGVAVWARRIDTPAASGASGDYVTVNQDEFGALYITPSSNKSGGFTPTRTSLSTTVTALKSSAQSKLGGWSIYNPNSVVSFIQIFNVATAGAVSLGSTAPTMTMGIPPFGAAISGTDVGIDFSAGLQIAATTTATGSSAPTTNIETTFWWK